MAYQLDKSGTEVDRDLVEGLDNQPKSNIAWDDLTNSLIASRLDSVVGGLQYNYDNNSITMNSAGDISNAQDRLVFNMQKPHAMSDFETMNLHIHWEQVNTNQVEFTVQYRVQSNNSAKTTVWTTATANSTDDSAFTYPGSGTFNQITRLVNIDLSSYSISSTVQVRLARTDSTTGDIEAVFVDAHVPYDQLGSRQEYVK